MSATTPAPLPLLADLDLGAATPLRDRIVEALDAGHGLVLDGEAVERVSTACLQVLVAAARAAARDNLSFLITNPSRVLAAAIADLALQDVLPTGS